MRWGVPDAKEESSSLIWRTPVSEPAHAAVVEDAAKLESPIQIILNEFPQVRAAADRRHGSASTFEAVLSNSLRVRAFRAHA